MYFRREAKEIRRKNQEEKSSVCQTGVDVPAIGVPKK